MENEEYLGDAPYCSLFPSFSKTVIFFFETDILFKVECRGDEGEHRYGHGMMMYWCYFIDIPGHFFFRFTSCRISGSL